MVSLLVTSSAKWSIKSTNFSFTLQHLNKHGTIKRIVVFCPFSSPTTSFCFYLPALHLPSMLDDVTMNPHEMLKTECSHKLLITEASLQSPYSMWPILLLTGFAALLIHILGVSITKTCRAGPSEMVVCVGREVVIYLSTHKCFYSVTSFSFFHCCVLVYWQSLPF